MSRLIVIEQGALVPGQGSENLREVQLKVIDCNKTSTSLDLTMILCTDMYDNDMYDTVKHPYHEDSGGPLFISHNGHYKQIGIVSAGIDKKLVHRFASDEDFYVPRFTRYARVNQFLDWIENHTRGMELGILLSLIHI